MNWPDTADGDVFRRLKEHKFDFKANYDIDFDIDFNEWPPQKEAIELIDSKYPNLQVFKPDEECEGYLSIRINTKLDYDFVIQMQNELTRLMQPYKGWCNAWGVLHG